MVNLFKNCYFELVIFSVNIKKCLHQMSLWEKRATIILFCISLILIVTKSYGWYIGSTKLMPAVGGEYREAVTGQVLYISPVLAQSDAEKSLSSLIFSSLVRFDGDKMIPDAAQKWDITDNGAKLTFYLRQDIFFSNGDKMTANDVAYTINQIKDPKLKSPLLDAWSNVTVTVDNDYQISFELPKPYGPFIYNCNFGIMPANVSSDLFAKKFISSGMYQFVKAKNDGADITEVDLKRNPSYYGTQPLVENLKFSYFANASDAKAAFDQGKDDALSGAISDDGKNFSYPTSKRLGLILNTRSDKLKDVAVRQKIITGQKLDQPLALTLTVPDDPLQKAKAQEIEGNLSGKNINLTVVILDPVKLQAAITARNYELLLYGFDFGHDRDPYFFYHSSQLNILNLSGWSDKATDILLEDARMIVDPVARNQKYDDIFNQLKSQYLIYYYDPINFNFCVNQDKIKNFKPITGNEASSRYNYISDWYIKEKRVKK